MRQMPTIEAEMTLLTTAEGGREHPLAPDPPTNYRPLVVGPIDYRPPVRTAGSNMREHYLGVVFLSCPVLVELGS